MISIGIRVQSNEKIHYAIVSFDPVTGVANYKTLSSIYVPAGLAKLEQLSFIRNTILDIMLEYQVNRAAIRTAELPRTVNQAFIERCYLEGVIQEAFANSKVEKFVVGQISKLSGYLGNRTHFKQYAEGAMIFPHVPLSIAWQSLNKETRESILACFAAFHI